MENSMEDYRTFLAKRRAAILEQIQSAAARSGRDASQVMLLAVSKTVGNEAVLSAYKAGYSVFGENRPQELKRKVAFVRQAKEMENVRFDMIGNLQKNKINQVLRNADIVQSVSSVHLAEAISRRALAQGMKVRCLLEVNVSGEASKSGVPFFEARLAMDCIMGMEGLEPLGLMTMAPANDASAARATFSGLRDLRDDLREMTGLELKTLSCGMSGDYKIAVEEGSTLVRLGRIVFDPSYKSV